MSFNLPTTWDGREPAVWAGLLCTILPFLVVINALHLNADNVALWSAVIIAAATVYTMLATQHLVLALLVGLFKAGIALAAGYGFALNADYTAAIIGASAVLFAFFQRTQTSPVVPAGA